MTRAQPASGEQPTAEPSTAYVVSGRTGVQAVLEKYASQEQVPDHSVAVEATYGAARRAVEWARSRDPTLGIVLVEHLTESAAACGIEVRSAGFGAYRLTVSEGCVHPRNPPDTNAEAPVVLVLSDGQQLLGVLTWTEDRSEAHLQIADGQVLVVPAAAVGETHEAAGATPPRPDTPSSSRPENEDPNSTRYLYTPSAFSLGAGQGYFAQRAWALSSFAVGLTNFLDIEGGIVLPLLFIPDAMIGTIGLKASTRVEDRLHLAAGAQLLAGPGVPFGLVFGAVTYGGPDAHVSLDFGPAMDFRTGAVGTWITTVGGNYRLGLHTALITENWLLYLPSGQGPWGGPVFAVPSVGVRLIGQRFAVDAAIVPVFSGDNQIPVVPLPWLSFAWNFGSRSPPSGAQAAARAPTVP